MQEVTISRIIEKTAVFPSDRSDVITISVLPLI